jgi:hypothetical protein
MKGFHEGGQTSGSNECVKDSVVNKLLMFFIRFQFLSENLS